MNILVEATMLQQPATALSSFADEASFGDAPASIQLNQADTQRLDRLYRQLQTEAQHFLGYPCNRCFDYEPLFRFLQFPVNNVGDPYLPSNYHLNTHEFECEVLAIFQQLTQAPPDNTWGYITNGGTEGNHYGLFLARELMPEGIVYYSQDAHYSIDKILRCLNIRSIMIRSHDDGSMDLDDLRETLRIHRDAPAIVCATVGTTMKGAIDDIAGIRRIFRELALHRHYIHVDAALSGMILPFVENAPPWNFAAGIDSIAISGHKMIGSPIPCGVVLAKKSNVDRVAQSVEYIGTLDTTLTGSRNAIAPLFLWYAFHTVGIEGFRRMIPQCLAMADYAITKLNEAGCHAWRHPVSNTVVFDRPPAAVTQQWQLACHGELSHVITMPHVTEACIDRLITDLVNAQMPAMPELERCDANTPCELSATAEDITLIGDSEDHLLAKVAAALAAAGLSIDALTSGTTAGIDVMRLQVSDRDQALQILSQTLNIGRCHGQAQANLGQEILSHLNYQPVGNDGILLHLPDRPGSLAQLLQVCEQAQITVRGVRLLWRRNGQAVVAIATSEPEQLRQHFPEQILSA
jgi:histidine decarboxylase